MAVQDVIVAIIVAVAAAYALRRFMPKAWRRRIVQSLTARGTRPSKLARWVDKDDSCGSGGGSACNTCNACDTEPSAANQDGKRVIKLRVEK